MEFTGSESVKLKSEYNDKIRCEIVAFLNSMDGIIYIGVEDDGTVIGVDDLTSSLEQISKDIDGILPNCLNFVELGTKYTNGKHVIKINVNRGNSLYYLKDYGRSMNGCFKFVGTSCKSMAEDEINRLQMKYLLSESKLVDIISPKQDLTFNTLKQLYKDKNLIIDDGNFELNTKLKSNDKYNLQAKLLADENDISIRVIEYSGIEKTSELKQKEFGEQCLISAMKEVYDYCINNVYKVRTISYDNRREDIELFSREAFREAWYNACLHNDWLDGTPPKVYIYDNRIEIISTGGLTNKFSKNEFFMGISKPVNESLSKVFIQLNLTQQTGYGVPLIVKKYGKDSFKLMDNFIEVVIPFGFNISDKIEEIVVNDTKNETKQVKNDTKITKNDTKETKTNKVSVETAIEKNIDNKVKTTEVKKEVVPDRTLTPYQQKVLECIKSNPDIKIKDIQAVVNKSEITVKRAIKDLVDKKYIEGKSSKGKSWKVL